MVNSILCCARSGGIPFKSLYVHTKIALNSFNNYSTSSILPIFSYALIFAISGSASVLRLIFN
jgi:hypothetical protein